MSDRLKGSVWRDPRHDIHQAETERLIAALVRHGDRVLDVGCGYGRFRPAVVAAGGRYLGWDNSSEMMGRFTAGGGPPGEFLLGDCLGTAPFAEESFNVVLGVMVCN